MANPAFRLMLGVCACVWRWVIAHKVAKGMVQAGCGHQRSCNPKDARSCTVLCCRCIAGRGAHACWVTLWRLGLVWGRDKGSVCLALRGTNLKSNGPVAAAGGCGGQWPRCRPFIVELVHAYWSQGTRQRRSVVCTCVPTPFLTHLGTVGNQMLQQVLSCWAHLSCCVPAWAQHGCFVPSVQCVPRRKWFGDRDR
jgi:hypothetical protein